MQTSKRKSSPDISSALVGKKQRLSTVLDEDQDISEFLQSSILKRDIKGGTKVIKNAKGKAKLAKGEVGGGSFQSMGYSLYPVQYTSYC
jgi:ATP-dependent RNA helicase DDX54/DBP10